MKGQVVLSLCSFSIALFLLFISVFRAVSLKYAYSPMVLSTTSEVKAQPIEITYDLPYPGRIHPDNPLWYVKVTRDRILEVISFDPSKKSKHNLNFANKRLLSSLYLFNSSKPDLGLSTLTKSGKYLEKTVDKVEDLELANEVATASLKHRQIIEQQILPLTPEDLKPDVIKAVDYSRESYKKARDFMLSKGAIPPNNPFDLD